MTIEPHSPPPEPRREEDGLPKYEWPSATTLIVIGAIVLVIILAFIKMN